MVKINVINTICTENMNGICTIQTTKYNAVKCHPDVLKYYF